MEKLKTCLNFTWTHTFPRQEHESVDHLPLSCCVAGRCFGLAKATSSGQNVGGVSFSQLIRLPKTFALNNSGRTDFSVFELYWDSGLGSFFRATKGWGSVVSAASGGASSVQNGASSKVVSAWAWMISISCGAPSYLMYPWGSTKTAHASLNSPKWSPVKKY